MEKRSALVVAGAVLALAAAGPVRAGVFQPEDFQYLGAFRTPVAMQSIQGSTTDALSYCKGTDAYYPDGDPTGADDGFPGSLFGIGHAWVTPMFEMSIPAPVISKNVSDLPVATLLQGPADVASPIEISGDGLKGIEYLPQQPGMSGAKLHITVGQHYQYDPRPTHGWLDLDLSSPHTAGAWYIGSETQVSCLNTNEYVFSIPQDWADANVGGMRLACGRYREGQVATGPSVIAYAPWVQGNPPAPGAHLPFVPLVLYRNLDTSHGLEGFCNADNWTGAVWLHNDDKAAVAVVGTKGLGNCWYGWQDGMRPEVCATWPGGCEANGYGGSNRGYYADSFRTVVLLYDPADLAKVASGEWQSWQPQPYVWWDITPYMIRPETTYEIGTGGVAYDDAHGLIYITERGGDTATEKNIVHVFKIAPPTHYGDGGGGGGGGGQQAGRGPVGSVYASPNPFHEATMIHVVDNAAAVAGSPLHVSIYDIRGKLVSDLGVIPGATTVQWDPLHRPGGIYFVRASGAGRVWTSKLSLVR